MKGIAGYNGWRWIFIIEGILTCVIAAIGYVVLVPFPDQAKGMRGFLNDNEVDFAVARIQHDRADVEALPFKIGEYLRHALDLKIWGFASLFGLCTITSYAIAYFLPVILRLKMGFDLAESQCLVAPPYAAAGIFMFVQGKLPSIPTS